MLTEVKALMRILRRNSMSCVAAIAMLAASITAASATFALADAVLWRDLPYRDPAQLGVLVTRHTSGENNVSMPDFVAVRERATGVSVAAAGTFTPDHALTGFGEPRQLRARILTADYFDVLGVTLVRGRNFTRAEEKPGAGLVVIITDRLRQQLFEQGDGLGAALAMNGRLYTVVGILPPYRDPFGDVDLYTPVQFAPTLPRRFRLLTPVVRLQNGASLKAFRQQLVRVTDAGGDPEAKGYTVDAVEFSSHLARSSRSSAALLFGAAIGLLGIALLNFTMLIAARVRNRQPEFSIRLAMGASRASILRLVALEAGALSVSAAGLAIAGSQAVLPLLQSRFGSDVVNAMGLNLRVIGFVAAISSSAILAAVFTAKRAFGKQLSSERRIASSRLTAGRGFVVAQVSISMALVVSSAALALSFLKLRQINPGFKTAGISTSRISLPVGRYPDGPKRALFFRSLLERLNERRTSAAAITTELPLSGQDNPTVFTARLSDGVVINPKVRSVSPNYLALLGIPLVSGRMLADNDRAENPLVVVINQRLASQLARLGPPIGQQLAFELTDPPMIARVVGIVGDIRHERLSSDPAPEAYFTFEQTPAVNVFSIVVDGAGGVADNARLLRSAIDTLDRGQPFTPVIPMSEYVERNLAGSQLQAQLLSFFSLVALIVAAFGLYGLLTYLVAGARRDWAIRLTLGATQAQLRLAVLRQSAIYSVLGVTLGMGLLALGSAALSAMIYGVSLWDPALIATCAAVMTLVCTLAAAIPAIRAGRISPSEALLDA
jgi:putative ABC transport system permease protein